MATRHWLRCLILCGTAVMLTESLSAQGDRSVAGLWRLDVERSDARDVYGEIRLIRQSDTEIAMTLADYGSAWIAGAFRGIVSIRPWTFRFGRWGPRRGPAESKQPRTLARRSGSHFVLAKMTFSGSGEFVWLWSIHDEGDTLLQQDTRRSWDEDFTVRHAEGTKTYFVRVRPHDAALASLGDRVVRGGSVAPSSSHIVISANADATTLFATCPEHDCVIGSIENGRRTGARALPEGEAAQVPLDSEVVIEPVVK
jgi:hypothetical protein